MAKAKKQETPKPKKKAKKDITISTDLSFEEMMKMAVNTPASKKKKNK